MRIRSQKNVGTGLMLMAFAAVFLWKSFDYRLGTAAAMGPAYFPTLLALLLLAVGAGVAAKGLTVDGPKVDSIPWRPLLILTGSTLAFAFLLPRAGLFIALVVLILGSASASGQFAFRWRSLAGALLLIGFCYAVFVRALGIPLPIVGSWF